MLKKLISRLLCPESRCRGCADCCRVKVVSGDRIVATNLYCPGLDLETRRCMMYGWRHTELGERLRGGFDCVGAWKGVWGGWYPRHCAYVRWYHPVKCGYDGDRLGWVVSDGLWADLFALTTRLRKRVKEECDERGERGWSGDG